MNRIPVLALVLLLAACGAGVRVPGVDQAAIERETEAQIEAYLLHRRDLVDKVDRVWPKLIHSAAPLCGKQTFYGFGLSVLDTLSDETPRTHVLRRIYGAGHVVGSAPFVAAQAGLKRGDLVLSVNGAQVVDGKAGRETLQKAFEATNKSGDPVRLLVKRGAETHDITVQPVLSCKYAIRFIDEARPNAFTDGETIRITTGMIGFFQSDAEMAFLLGHELAHGIQGHIAAQQAGRVAGTVIGLLVTALTGADATGLGAELGGLAGSQDRETEADIVGLYAAAQAGYDVAEIPKFWRRLSAVAPDAIHNSMLGTHPSNVNRALVIERIASDIARKKASGLALVPDVK